MFSVIANLGLDVSEVDACVVAVCVEFLLLVLIVVSDCPFLLTVMNLADFGLMPVGSVSTITLLSWSYTIKRKASLWFFLDELNSLSYTVDG